ncbi:MAG: FHA domain-containing protein [Kangiellaceae bacterium]|jgi:pSer/pThr/pTyr-binding forkhead associated (FHA) protein|nr:FHA domain-containing protein [Kangiellaceae bacterium]
MTDKNTKVGPQGTQVFDLSEVESLLAEELKSQKPEHGSPCLIGVTKPFVGTRFELDKAKLQVGRTPSSDIYIDEPSVSSTHAYINLVGQQWRVTNLLSSNGTFVNGDKVADSDIYPGDKVRFGGVEFVFTLHENKEAKKAPSSVSLAVKVTLLGIVVIAGLAAAAYYLM